MTSSKVLETAFSVLPPAAAELLTTALSKLQSEALIQLFSNPTACLVFKAAVPRFGRDQLRSIVASLGPQLSNISDHPTLELVARQASRKDPTGSLVQLATWLDRANLFLSHQHASLVRQVMAGSKCRHLPFGTLFYQVKIIWNKNIFYFDFTGASPRVCGLVLNVVSGKLSSVVEDKLGREVLQLLLMHGSDLQVKSQPGCHCISKCSCFRWPCWWRRW